MPQVFQVLRCYKCLAFQVHQVKKSNKWECKICGEKQSLKRHYGTGTGKDCRVHVQKLNELRGETDKNNLSHVDSDVNMDYTENIMNNVVEEEATTKSKWCNYVEENSETNASLVDKENETLFRKEVVLEIFNKRKKEFRKNMRKKFLAYKKNKYKLGFDEEDVCDPIDGSSASHYTAPTQKRLIKKFIPPAAHIRSKWTEYNEPEYFDNQRDIISNSDLSFINNENEIHIGELCTNNKTNNHFTTDTLTVGAIDQEVFKSDKEKNVNSHNLLVGETYKQPSKWAEFIDNSECGLDHAECTEDSQENGSQDFEYSLQKDSASVKPSNLFSLCDENDLDSVLDI